MNQIHVILQKYILKSNKKKLNKKRYKTVYFPTQL